MGSLRPWANSVTTVERICASFPPGILGARSKPRDHSVSDRGLERANANPPLLSRAAIELPHNNEVSQKCSNNFYMYNTHCECRRNKNEGGAADPCRTNRDPENFTPDRYYAP